MAIIRSLVGVAVLFTCVSASPAQQTAMICTSGGVNYQIGDIACIPACHGSERLARCVASNGAASWSTISDSCPSAMAPVLPSVRTLSSAPDLRIPLSDPDAGSGTAPGEARLSGQVPVQPVMNLPLSLSANPTVPSIASLAALSR